MVYFTLFSEESQTIFPLFLRIFCVICIFLEALPILPEKEAFMQDKKVNEEALVNIYKNAHIALQSLSNLTPEVVDLDFKQELLDQYEGYEKIIGEISRYMKEHDMEPKDINPLKKAMIWSSIKMNTLADKSKSHMADMMVQGTVMGIVELTQLKNESGSVLNEDVLDFADRLLALEEGYEEKLKTYL